MRTYRRGLSATVVGLLAAACAALPPEQGHPAAAGDPPQAGTTEAAPTPAPPAGAVPPETVPVGLVPLHPTAPETRPPPAVRSLLDLPACEAEGGLAAWTVEALAPYGDVSGEAFVRRPLAEVVALVPLLTGTEPAPVCSVAGTRGGAQAWELRGDGGDVLARAVSSPELAGTYGLVHRRQRDLGGVNFGQSPIASQQQLAGVWFGDRFEVEWSQWWTRESALLIVDGRFEGEPTRDPEGQLRAELHAARLSTAVLGPAYWFWASPLPRAVPPGYARCAGPVAAEGWSERTELCTPEGDRIVVTSTNRGSNPIPDPPFTTTVREQGDRLLLEVDTPVLDATIDVPASLGRDVLDTMASTVPLLDPRTWAPARPRGHEFLETYDEGWLRDTLVAAGATGVTVADMGWDCPAGEQPTGAEAEEGRDCEPPAHPGFEVTVRAPAGGGVEGYVFADLATSGQRQAPSSVTRLVTVSGTDVHVEESTGHAGAWGACGGLRWMLRPEGVGTGEPVDDVEPALDLLARVLRHLDC